MTATVALGVSTAGEQPLPPLRTDLQLLKGPRDRSGAPTWTLYDPAANRYFAIGWREFELLARWQPGRTAAWLATTVSASRPLEANEAHVQQLIRFLAANQLLATVTFEGRRALAEQARKAKKGIATSALHHYLFFRIPLLRPDRLLAVIGPLLSFAFRPWFWIAIAVIGATGLLLALRRWDEFVTTFNHFLSPRGLVLYLCTLTATKVIHEFAHALAAWRHGVRVPTMGIAFMVLWPVLFTDATGAWGLASRRARLQIAGAGILAELALSALATFAWVFLPDGPVRGAVFFLATTSWVLTLAVNLNPLMRFDGYYLLADTWGIPNLQDRSFALGRWFLRKALLGLDEPAPESLPTARAAALIAYAYAVWVYRLILFFGIALLVYHFTVKLLGLVLGAFEILWFIVRPVVREMGAWWGKRAALRPNARLLLGLALILVGLPVTVTAPLPVGLTAPAVWRAAVRADIYAPLDARVVAIHARRGDTVAAGDPLLTLDSPDLATRIAQTEREVTALRRQLDALATDLHLRSQLDQTQRQYERTLSRLEGLERERERLAVRIPVSGIVAHLDPDISPGRWIGEGAWLALVADTAQGIVDAYVPESLLPRLTPGSTARFEPEDPDRPPVDATVGAIDGSPIPRLDAPLLATIHGGSIPVRESASGGLVPHGSYYRVRLIPRETASVRNELAGRVTFQGEPESIADRIGRAFVATLVRESGF